MGRASLTLTLTLQPNPNLDPNPKPNPNPDQGGPRLRRHGGRGGPQGRPRPTAREAGTPRLVIASRAPRTALAMQVIHRYATPNLCNTPFEAGAPHQKASAQLTRRETRLLSWGWAGKGPVGGLGLWLVNAWGRFARKPAFWCHGRCPTRFVRPRSLQPFVGPGNPPRCARPPCANMSGCARCTVSRRGAPALALRSTARNILYGTRERWKEKHTIYCVATS